MGINGNLMGIDGNRWESIGIDGNLMAINENLKGMDENG